MNELIVELVITEECNLGCTYCYMENKSVYMEETTLDLFFDNISSIMKIYNKDCYHISYFGGEPLLNWAFIKQSMPRFNADPRCSSKVIITNGLLLDEEKLIWLKENGLGVSLSFDGLWNEFNRPLRSGQSSLAIYKKKRDLFHKFGINSCKVMIGPGSLESMVTNYRFFRDDFQFPNPDFSLVRDSVWSWDDVKLFQTNIALLADELIADFNQGISGSIGLFTLMLLDMLMAAKRGKRPMGCFAGCGGVGFLPSGIFYPCARFGSDHQFPLLDTRKGLLFEDNITKLKDPCISNPQHYIACNDCEIRAYCNGGCNRSFLENGNWDHAEPIPQLCSLYKAISKETLRIHSELKANQTYRQYIMNITTPFKGYLA